MQAYTAHQPPDNPPTGPVPALLEIARFGNKRDTRPRRQRVTWDALAAELLRHAVRREKDGPLWSPAAYPDGATRKDEHVAAVTALVYDVDGAAPDWHLLDGLAFAAYTTHSHLVVCEHNPTGAPCWRLVLPLTRPVARADWRRVWRRARARYAPEADPACSDASRMYYLPACPPGARPAAQRGEGAPVDPAALPETPEEAQERELAAARPARPAARGPLDGERPGDRYARETSWAGILEPVGWRSGGVRRGQEIWIRPGRTDDRDARSANTTRDGNLWVWTSNAPPFAPNVSYTKLHAHVLLEHGGDWRAAVRALAERYGPPLAVALTHRRDGTANGHAPPPAAPGPAPALTRPEPDGYLLTDYGNAERLVAHHGRELRYCPTWHKWLVYDAAAGRWVEDAGACRVKDRARATVRRMAADAVGLLDDDPEGARRLFTHATRSEMASRLAAMVAVAEGDPGVWVTPDELDADPWVLNVGNGTIDLRTGGLRRHDPADLLTMVAPVEYHPDAAAPTWERFIGDVTSTAAGEPDPELAGWLRRLLGYGVTGDVSEQQLPFAHGAGANGKNTLTEAIAGALGPYAMQAPDHFLMAKSQEQHPTELADLYRKRLVVANETERGKRFNESLVKKLTGGDRVRARRMREDFWEFAPTHKVLVCGNHKPEVLGTDHALWRRLWLVPFDATFYDRADDVPAGKREPGRWVKDTKLPARLAAELPGVLAWLVRGCLEWQRRGLHPLPKRVEAATRAYRSEMDTLAAFLKERCQEGPNCSVFATPLWEAFKAWCDQAGEQPGKQREFGQRMTERGFHRRDSTGGRARYYGVGLREDDRPPSTGPSDPSPPFPSSGGPPSSDPSDPKSGTSGPHGPDSRASTGERVTWVTSGRPTREDGAALGSPRPAERVPSSPGFFACPRCGDEGRWPWGDAMYCDVHDPGQRARAERHR